MRRSPILLVDAAVNLILGVLLVTFPSSIVGLLGVPQTDATFYPSILGAVLLGIAVALVVEYVRTSPGAVGLGLVGAVSINLIAAIFLAGWLLSAKLAIPLRGQIFLWVLAAGLVVISIAELLLTRKRTGQ
jgi:hypothetical protein